jgi:hypothetical protein
MIPIKRKEDKKMVVLQALGFVAGMVAMFGFIGFILYAAAN